MILEAKEVSYFYKSQKDKLILDHINYGFACGKIYAILGPSGSGKTTFLSLLAGLDMPAEGEICYNGKAITTSGLAEHRRHHVSLVFQSYNLIDYLTPLENVKLGGKKSPDVLLNSVGIAKELWGRSVLQLSGGQQQRVAIARALASNATVLLADEPTGNLDEATAWDVIDLLKHIAHDENKCVIVVTHSKELAAEADAVIQIKDLAQP
ncbi:MAG: putative transport system ATP-binding protein [Clostridiales bacterium]|jgi:putative ABC transport system ATP-binding protein|nr:putative transport system ATP-binding protein [Clostridiales bacterium]